MKTLTENQKTWLAALRSGEYKQGNSALRYNGKFCCLGVAAEIFKTEDTKIKNTSGGITYDSHIASAPEYAVEALNLRSRFGDDSSGNSLKRLSSLNDNGKTFNEIADIFESNLEEYTE